MSRFALAAAVALTTAEAGTLKLTYSDCGSKHGHVDSMSPTTFSTGTKVTVTGTGTIDEDVTAASITATISALGTQLCKVSGDGTTDLVCKLPLDAATITVPALPFPLAKGTLSLPVLVETSPNVPPQLASVDVHVTANDQNGESAVCLDAHTEASVSSGDEEALASAVALTTAETVTGTLQLTYKDCGSKHGKVTGMSPTSFSTGTTVTITGTGTIDEDVTAASLKATISALGTQLADCSGDGTSDIVCQLPMNTGTITLPALPFPLAKGALSLPIKVYTSPIIPASLASVDIHLTADDQNGESAICLDAHTEAQTSVQV